MQDILTKKGQCLVVIPALNESETIAEVISDIRHEGYHHILVVSDASDDGTDELARKAGAEVISLPEQLGAWVAVQTGVRFAIKKGFSIVITMDADGQHPAEQIDKLLTTLEEKSANVVIGSFTQRGSKLRHIAWNWIRAVSGLKLDDVTSGFRVYDEISQRVVASWRGTLLEYQDVGVLLLLQRYGLAVEDAPVTMSERQVGQSRIFYNWAVVAYYMSHTLVLGAAKRRVTRKKRFLQTSEDDT